MSALALFNQVRIASGIQRFDRESGFRVNRAPQRLVEGIMCRRFGDSSSFVFMRKIPPPLPGREEIILRTDFHGFRGGRRSGAGAPPRRSTRGYIPPPLPGRDASLDIAPGPPFC
jgi:hypothetical protein